MEYLESQAGGRIAFVQALTASKNPAAKALILALGKSENDDKPIFEVALQINKDPMELQKAFSEGLQLQNAVEAANKMFSALPDVMEGAINTAKKADKDGHADRKLIFEMSGLLKKDGGGLQISLNQNFQGMVPTGNPVKGTHDLLHTDPFDEVIDVDPKEDDE